MKYFFLILALFTFNLFGQDGQTANCLENITVPEAFSPNGDYHNDVFFIAFPCEPTAFEIKIYDNWGNPVFESTEFTFRWTGNNESGVAQPNGVYVYTLTFSDQSQTYNLSGEVTLVR
jgi:gliding motility-associated-like protein